MFFLSHVPSTESTINEVNLTQDLMWFDRVWLFQMMLMLKYLNVEFMSEITWRLVILSIIYIVGKPTTLILLFINLNSRWYASNHNFIWLQTFDIRLFIIFIVSVWILDFILNTMRNIWFWMDNIIYIWSINSRLYLKVHRTYESCYHKELDIFS